jgi:sugar phosphate isomerase/epimerase
MGTVGVGMNLLKGKSFEAAMEEAAQIGYEYTEPMVHWGRELLAEARYAHTVSMLDDPLRVKNCADRLGLKVSAFSSHAPLCLPEISTDYLRQAVRFAKEAGVPYVITDDGVRRPGWATLEQNQTLMRYVLEEVVASAEARGIVLALETHGDLTATPEDLAATFALVDSPAIGINFDTGNAYLSGNDPHEWLEDIIGDVVHVHAKDISQEMSDTYRGKVRGLLGCACGDGLIDWARIVRACRSSERDIVLSVECGTAEEAKRSLEHLTTVIDANR